jgi:hypothetical protein
MPIMSQILRSPGLSRVLLLATVGLVPVGLPLLPCSTCLACSFTYQDYGGQEPEPQFVPGLGDLGQLPGDDEGIPRRSSKSKGARKKSRLTEKDATKKNDASGKTKSSATKTKGTNDGRLRFSQDVAPILVANCIRCHSGDGVGVTKGKLNLSTFANLQKGTPDHQVISPKNPEESSLVLRIKGLETPRMPQGGNQVLSDAAIATVERWVKEGAKLDLGLDPKKPIESYAASSEQVRRAQAARLPQGERDKEVEAAGLKRWKQANPKVKPDIVRGEHFVMFSMLPRDRAGSTLKVMETQYGHIRRMLGAAAANWVEKVGVYVFASRSDFIEFVRSVENREVESGDMSTGRLAVPQPYVAVVDPLGGRAEEPGAARRKGRTRRGEDAPAEAAGTDRTLNGLLTEALGASAVASAGNPPRWLVHGVGAFLACQVEPRSARYHQLRQTALANYQQGWTNRANEALGGTDQITPDGLRAVGFALVEAMMSVEVTRRYFPAFVSGMLEGGDKLDDTLRKVLHGTREEFLNDTGEWIAVRYGHLE